MKNRLSIVVTAHREGLMSKRAIDSFIFAVKKLKELSIDYEFLVNIDNGDQITTDTLNQFDKNPLFKIFYTSYGDPGLARNSIISRTDGEFVAVIDADDMVSSNWLFEALSALLKMRKNSKAIMHPELEVRYDNEGVRSVTMRRNRENIWQDNLALIVGNQWCSVAVGRRELFIDTPYSVSDNGFGYEDYYFNCETSSKGVRHIVVPGTTAFCFQKQESVTTDTHLKNKVLPYTNLFDLPTIQKEYKKNKKSNIVPDSRQTNGVPKFVLEQADFLSRKDLLDRGFSEKIKLIEIFKNMDTETGLCFCKMIEGIDFKNNNGIAVFIDGIVDFQEMKYNKRSIYIAPECGCVLPKKKNTINFGQIFASLPTEIRDALISRLIIQIPIRKMVFNQDSFIDEWVKKYGAFLDRCAIKTEYLI